MRAILLVSGFLPIAAVVLEAQEPDGRDRGFFVAFSVGWGSLDYGGSDPPQKGSGLGGFLPRVGYRLSPSTALALQVHGFARSATVSYGGVQGLVELSPRWSRDFRFAIGLGSDRVRVESRADGRDPGLGVYLSAAYDCRLSRIFALSPYVAYQNGWLDLDDARLVSAGLGFTFW